jgi:hypothetical protein
MADETPKKDIGQPQEHDLPLDTQLLSDAVIELNISRKNVAIYPPGHIQITKSIDRAFAILTRMLEMRPEMTLGIAKDTLLVGRDYLDRKNPVYRDLALALNQQGIAAVTFVSGLEREELVQFHRILTTKPEEVRSAGGIDAVLASTNITHIGILSIDYRSFHVTEEEEITKPAAKSPRSAESDLWQDFVSLLSQGALAGPNEGAPLVQTDDVDPAELARMLNERRINPSSAVQSYARVISEHVREKTREQSKTLSTFNALLKDLHPDLRKQFLSVAFDRASNGPAGAAAEVIGGFTDDMIIEMLSLASTEGREISPTLTGLVSKLASTGSDPFPNGERGERSVGPGVSVSPIESEKLQKLFDRERYETYVSKDYDAMLRQMTKNSVAVRPDFPLADHLATLDDRHLDFQIGRALIAFIEEDIDEEDYREFSAKLIGFVPDFLETGNFETLFDISETLRRHAAEKPAAGIRAIAEEARRTFTDPGFIAKALEAFESWMRDKGQEAAGLIHSLGPDVVPGLMDIFSRDETPGGRRILMNLLCLFGEPALHEAYKRLRDPRAYFVRNLLIFIRRAGTVTSMPHIKPLLRHQDLDIRVEALSSLLKFKDPGSTGLLAAAIRSDDLDASSRAIGLAGQYRVTAVTGDVLARIKKVILFEADYQWNEDVIRALGEIGDARALPDLEKLARAGLSLYPQALMRMKETLYESLGRYPRESITGLLRIGERLGSDKIKRSCKKLAERP